MTSFTDDFNRADSTTVGNGWVEVAEDWSIASNRLAPGSAGGTGIIRCGTAMATDDNSAQATIAVASAVSCGVWCRGDTVFGNGYLWRNDGTSWDLFRNSSGSFTALATFPGAAVNGDIAKIQAVGTTIKAFVNGVERASVTDSGIATGKNTGMRCAASSTVRYDDFTAADVGAGSITGTGSVTAPPSTASGTGTVIVAGTGAATAAPAAGAGVGTAPVGGTGSATALPAAAVGAGAVIVTGSGVAIAPPAQVSGAGTATPIIDGSGNLVAPGAIITGSGAVVITGSGQATAPPAVVNGGNVAVQDITFTIVEAPSGWAVEPVESRWRIWEA